MNKNNITRWLQTHRLRPPICNPDIAVQTDAGRWRRQFETYCVTHSVFGAGNGNNTFAIPDLRDRLLLGKGTNNSTLGAQTGSMAASATKASESTTIASHSTTTGTFATSAKDSSQSTAVTGLTDHAAITPNMIFPTAVVNFIIKL